MVLLQVNLLGGIEVATLPGEQISIPCRKAAALLGYLALNSRRTVTRSKLAALLWSDRPEDQSRASLRQALMALRRALPQSDAVITSDREGISISPGAIATDVEELERLLKEREPAQLVRAAALYRGELLDGVGSTSAWFEAWLTAERQRLKSLAIVAITTLMGRPEDREWIESGIALALSILAIDPLQESVHRALMRCYLMQGRRGDALRQYARCRTALWEEVHAAPEGETERLHRDIRHTPRRNGAVLGHL